MSSIYSKRGSYFLYVFEQSGFREYRLVRHYSSHEDVVLAILIGDSGRREYGVMDPIGYMREVRGLRKFNARQHHA